MNRETLGQAECFDSSDRVVLDSRSSNSRTRIRPPLEVARDPWNSIFKEALNKQLKGLILFLTH
jgi:hypothetical protein